MSTVTETAAERNSEAWAMYQQLQQNRKQLESQHQDFITELRGAAAHPELYPPEILEPIKANAAAVAMAYQQAFNAEQACFTENPELSARRERELVTNGHDPTPADVRPTIKITADLIGMMAQAEDALLPLGVLYQRSRHLVRVAPAGKASVGLNRPEDAPIMTPVSLANLREHAARASRWTKYDKRDKKHYDARPDAVVLETLAARSEWRFPYLSGIICAPTLTPDGRVVTQRGYDAQSGLYLDCNGTIFPPVPDAPTREDARTALDALYAPFADFPFAEDCHRSAAIAGVLTLIGRSAIAGCTPLFAVRAHAPASGKGLLVNTVAMIGTGRCAPVWQHTEDDNEVDKRLLAIGMAGDTVVHIDNVTKPFGSGRLDSAITARSIKGRLLGTNSNLEVPWQTVLFASGNNMTFIGDMARRVIPIDLDAKTEHPEARSDFTHRRLLDWVGAERPRLVTAALTVLRAFWVAGCPQEPETSEYGSFEPWSDLIRHSLLWCGLPDPCGGRTNIEAESDPAYEALATLLTCWGVCYPHGTPRTLKTITQDAVTRRTADPKPLDPANEWNDLFDALAAYDSKHDGKRLDTKRIGNALRTIEGRVLDGVRLVRRGTSNNVTLWKREGVK